MSLSSFLAIGVAAGVVALFIVQRRRKQRAFIDGFDFHPAIARKVQAKYPHLGDEELALVFEALRDYFHICNRAGRRMVAMPSQVVDVAWHEFILFTRPYQVFCRRALGRFLHHTPTEAMYSPTVAREGIKRAWRLACARDGVDPATPVTLPLLFAIDTRLEIEDGFRYVPDCRDRSSAPAGASYCAGHIGCASGCGGGSGAADGGGGWFGDSDSSGCNSGCGGGCGGD